MLVNVGTSLVVQGLRIRLPVQGNMASIPVREDSTATEQLTPVSRNYGPRALEPMFHKGSHHNEKTVHHNEKAVPIHGN